MNNYNKLANKTIAKRVRLIIKVLHNHTPTNIFFGKIRFSDSPPTKHVIHMLFRFLGQPAPSPTKTQEVFLGFLEIFSTYQNTKCFSASRLPGPVHLPKHKKSVSRFLRFFPPTKTQKCFSVSQDKELYYQSTIFFASVKLLPRLDRFDHFLTKRAFFVSSSAI